MMSETPKNYESDEISFDGLSSFMMKKTREQCLLLGEKAGLDIDDFLILKTTMDGMERVGFAIIDKQAEQNARDMYRDVHRSILPQYDELLISYDEMLHAKPHEMAAAITNSITHLEILVLKIEITLNKGISPGFPAIKKDQQLYFLKVLVPIINDLNGKIQTINSYIKKTHNIPKK